MAQARRVTQPIDSCSEHELVAALRRGEESAFEELFSRYRRRISSYIFGMLGDHGRAEDIAQEVFISALRRLRATEHPIAFKPWIYEIAKNACIDEFRRTRRAQQVPLDVVDESTGSMPIGPRLISGGPSPDVAVESKQQLEDLCGAFGGLSDSHHRIIVLRELEGLSYSQIGQRMGMSRPVVESTLFRARRRLTREYEDVSSGRRCQQLQAVIDRAEDCSVRAPGLRERRQLARHFAHCQPCRRHARMAGFDESVLEVPHLAGKIAALLPLPWLRWRRTDGTLRRSAPSAHSAHSLASMPPVQAVARLADPASPLAAGLGRGAAAAAAVVIAGVSGGVVTGLAAHRPDRAPTISAARSTSGGAQRGSSLRGASASAAGGPGSAASTGVTFTTSAFKAHIPGRSGSVSGAGLPGSGSSGGSSGPPGANTVPSAPGSVPGGALTNSTGPGSPSPGAPTAGGDGTNQRPSGAPPSGSPPQSLGWSTPLLDGLPSVPGMGSLPLPPLPKVSLPALPPINLPPLPNASLPALPPINLPPLPNVSLPALPHVKLPSVSSSSH
ncbi:MAG: sigma-70 family RNA polymerase sigma factor [Solirubrobacteraceae bacterium]